MNDLSSNPTSASVLDLTTQVAPTKKFTIDGEEYDLLTLEHLSPEKESLVTATFARFQRIYNRLERASNDGSAIKEASKLRHCRETLILAMTSAPADVVSELGPTAQGKILDAIQTEIVLAGGGADDDEDDDVDESADDDA